MKIWKDEEVKSLFDEVENCKNKALALREAFAAHAKKFGRKTNSVRNYYYHEIDNLEKDKKRCLRLNINLALHTKSHFESFDKKQEEELFEKIQNMTQKGCSVRKACLQLSGGDLSNMTRLVNKYQNMRKKISLTENIKDNIIPFKNKQKTLTDSDINSLFLGLVRLIKKTALEESEANLSASNNLLKKAFSDLSAKDREMQSLKAEFEKLKNENQQLRLKLEKDKKSALQQHLFSKREKEEEKSKRV